MDEIRHGSPVVEKTAQLLSLVADAAPAGISLGQLVEKLGAARSTVYRILNSLSAHGLVARVNGGSSYELGPKFVELARRISPDSDRATLIEAARPILQSAADRIRESFKLSAPEGDEMMTLLGAASPAEYSLSIKVGSRSPKHVGAAGKLSLAHSTEAEVDAYCSHGLAPRSPFTITEPDVLREALARIRAEGIAEDSLESGPAIRALAAPVYDSAGQFVAAVSVPFIGDATPDRLRPIRREVLAAAASLTRALDGRPLGSNKAPSFSVEPKLSS